MLRITWKGTGDYNDRQIEVFEVLELVGLGVEDAVCVHVCVRPHVCPSIRMQSASCSVSHPLHPPPRLPRPSIPFPTHPPTSHHQHLSVVTA